MPAILFVCLANRYRSPLAAAFFCKCLEQHADRADWIVGSAGTWAQPGLPADSRAVKDAREKGLDIKSHRSRPITANLLFHSNLVITMEGGQKEALQVEFPSESKKICLLSEAVDGVSYDIPDPNDRDASHKDIAKELFELILRGYENICDLAIRNQRIIDLSSPPSN